MPIEEATLIAQQREVAAGTTSKGEGAQNGKRSAALEAHPETGVSAIPRVVSPLFPTQGFPNGDFLDESLGTCRLYHADCLGLEGLKNLADNSVNLVLTDPHISSMGWTTRGPLRNSNGRSKKQEPLGGYPWA